MSSQRKHRAARENGAKGRGRKTPEGIARSAMNALTHGLTAELIVLPNESESDFQELREAYLREFQPLCRSEADLVEELVAARWRMRRVWAMETRLLNVEILKQQQEVQRDFETIDGETRTALAFKSLCDNSGSLSLLDRHEARFRRTIDRVLRALNERSEDFQNEANPKNGHPPEPAAAPPEPSDSPPDPASYPDRPPLRRNQLRTSPFPVNREVVSDVATTNADETIGR